MSYVPRLAEERLHFLASLFPAIAVTGPRPSSFVDQGRSPLVPHQSALPGTAGSSIAIGRKAPSSSGL